MVTMVRSLPLRRTLAILDSGKPLVVYHGAINTDGGFDVFDRTAGKYATHARSINAVGSWFTSASEDARVFSGSTNPERFAAGGQTYAVHLSIKRPFPVRDSEHLSKLWQAHAGGDSNLQNGDPDKFRAWAESRGIDGFVMDAQNIDRFAEAGSKFYIALNPEQIKSATGNRGTFDPANPDIRFSRNGSPTRGMSATRLSAAVKGWTQDWAGDAPRVVTLAKADGLPDMAKKAQGWQTAEGFYDDTTGTVYLIAENLGALDRARQVLAHEAIGHYGIEANTGPALRADLAATIRKMRDGGKHAELFSEIGRRYDLKTIRTVFDDLIDRTRARMRSARSRASARSARRRMRSPGR